MAAKKAPKVSARSRLPQIKRGDVITANPFLNSIINQLNGDLSDFKAPKQLEEGAQPTEDSDALSMVAELLLENEYDLLVTKPGGGLTFVAKPPNLWGSIATRTVNGEAQEILPPYVIGDLIYAIRGIDGGTRLVGSQLADGSFVFPEWLDLNVDARAWAESD